MDLSIPDPLIYAGLAGSLIALIVATAQQDWQPKVFFLLALRIAIGWHFMSEGMHKIHSYYVGESETNRPFTSAPYFRESEGPISELMRSLYLENPEAKLNDFVRPATRPTTLADLLGADAAGAIRRDFADNYDAANVTRLYTPTPPDVIEPNFYADALLKLPLNGAGSRFLADYPAESALRPVIDAKVRAQLPPAADKRYDAMADRIRGKIRDVNEARGQAFELRLEALVGGPGALASNAEARERAFERLLEAFKATHARWSAGVESRNVKKKFVSGDIVQNVPARLADYDARAREVEELKARRRQDVGRSTLFAKIQATKADMTSVRTELVADVDKMFADAQADLIKTAGVAESDLPPEPPAPPEPIKALDFRTMWMLTVVGACLMIGLGTRVAAIVGAVFLVMTYLTYPPFPWLPNPPATEGNPVFVNKNLIEAIALMAIASMPTGQWLGVDALIRRVFVGPLTATTPAKLPVARRA